MADQDDDRWLDALAGRGPADADATTREASAVRDAMLRAEQKPVLEAQEVESGLARLRQRLDREGLLVQRREAANWGRWSMAASVLAVVGLVTWMGVSQQTKEPEFGYRGGKVQEVIAPEPTRVADTLAADFRAIGIDVVRLDGGGVVLLEVLVQNRADPKLGELLAKHKLAAGDSGPILLRVARTKR